ncbi:hypothetical protein Ciccas_009985 [Cichlidogyrus casuarinus]|uniref:C2H2-type domain-containing protein n=1 Tax=Cichlidogyrus casuarinus TaxID=1844966 RepID=A0ABD2PVF6_9PLAT
MGWELFWEHQRTHIRPEKQLECSECNFVTEYKHHLEYHLRSHAGQKPHKCDKCNYRCVNKSMLNSHMKSHTNIYPYRCLDCNYATKYCHSLKLHLNKHNHRPDIVLNPDGSLPDLNSLMDMSKSSSHTARSSCGTSKPGHFVNPLINGSPAAKASKLNSRASKSRKAIVPLVAETMTAYHQPISVENLLSFAQKMLFLQLQKSMQQSQTEPSPAQCFPNPLPPLGLNSFHCPQCSMTFENNSLFQFHLALHAKSVL